MDNAQHTVHRLEAFSDIVIGFCLAQLGLSLVLPKNATDVFSVWESTTFFISAFILIAVLWWLHHRTFSSFFVLNMPMVVLNFGVLCGLTLTLYFLEGMVRIAGLGQNPALFFSLFIFSFSVVYALMGAMLLVGILVRRSELHAAELRWGINRFASIAIAVVFGLAAGAYAAVRPHIAWIGLASIVFAIGAGLLRRIVLNRWLDRTLPAGYR
jgi:uncharacterized membrane protein